MQEDLDFSIGRVVRCNSDDPHIEYMVIIQKVVGDDRYLGIVSTSDGGCYKIQNYFEAVVFHRSVLTPLPFIWDNPERLCQKFVEALVGHKEGRGIGNCYWVPFLEAQGRLSFLPSRGKYNAHTNYMRHIIQITEERNGFALFLHITGGGTLPSCCYEPIPEKDTEQDKFDEAFEMIREGNDPYGFVHCVQIWGRSIPNPNTLSAFLCKPNHAKKLWKKAFENVFPAQYKKYKQEN